MSSKPLFLRSALAVVAASVIGAAGVAITNTALAASAPAEPVAEAAPTAAPVTESAPAPQPEAAPVAPAGDSAKRAEDILKLIRSRQAK